MIAVFVAGDEAAPYRSFCSRGEPGLRANRARPKGVSEKTVMMKHV